MPYGKTKYLVKRTQLDKVLKDEAFKIANNPNYDGYQRGLASVYEFFFIKNPKEMVLLMNQIISWQINFINQLLKDFKKEKFIHHI